MGGWSPVSISMVIRFVFPISSLLFENISGKQSHSSSYFCAVSSSIGLLFSFTFLCLLTSARLHKMCDFGGTGNDPLFFGTQFLYFLLSFDFFYFEDFIFFFHFFLCKSNYSPSQDVTMVYIAKIKKYNMGYVPFLLFS